MRIAATKTGMNAPCGRNAHATTRKPLRTSTPLQVARLRPRLLALGIALLAVLPYLNGLRNGFTFDDIPLVAENPRIRSFAGLREVFMTDWWGGERSSSLLYRPLTMATFAADYAAAAQDACDDRSSGRARTQGCGFARIRRSRHQGRARGQD